MQREMFLDDEAKRLANRPEDRNDYRTPGWFWEAMLAHWGEIALDPCSNPWARSANITKRYMREMGHNALELSWDVSGLVYCNPPYGRGMIDPFVTKAAATRPPTEVIMLVPGDFSTDWWQRAARLCHGMCLMNERVQFVSSFATSSSAFPSTVFYWGADMDRFTRCFDHQGAVFGQAGSIPPA